VQSGFRRLDRCGIGVRAVRGERTARFAKSNIADFVRFLLSDIMQRY